MLHEKLDYLELKLKLKIEFKKFTVKFISFQYLDIESMVTKRSSEY